jgi:hypothetical protein
LSVLNVTIAGIVRWIVDELQSYQLMMSVLSLFQGTNCVVSVRLLLILLGWSVVVDVYRGVLTGITVCWVLMQVYW